MGIFLLLNACIALFPCFCSTMWRWTVLSYYMGCRNRFNSSPAQEEISSKFSSGHLQRPNVTGFSEMKKKNPVASLGKKKVRRQAGTDSLPYMHFLHEVLNKTRITFTIQSKSAFNPSSPKPTCNARLSQTRNKKISWTWAAICSIANWRHTDVKAALWCRQHMCHIYPFSVNAKKSKHCIWFSQISSVHNEVFAVCLVDGCVGYLTLSIKDNISPPATDLQFPFH